MHMLTYITNMAYLVCSGYKTYFHIFFFTFFLVV